MMQKNEDKNKMNVNFNKINKYIPKQLFWPQVAGYFYLIYQDNLIQIVTA